MLSFAIGHFVFLSIAIADMPLGCALFIIFHGIPSHFALERFPSYFHRILAIDSSTFLLSSTFPFVEAYFALAGASAHQRASLSVSSVWRGVFGVKWQNVVVRIDV